MFTTDNIPKDYESDSDKEKYCKGKIKEKYGELNKGCKTVTEIQIELGQLFITLKGVVREDGKKWKTYVNKNFRYITIRTVQRWMKLGKEVDIDNYPRLSYAGQTRLLALANIAKKESTEIHSLLKDNGISLEFKPKKASELRSFKDEIDKLIKQYRGRAKTRTSATKIFKRLSNATKDLSRELDFDDASETISKDDIDKSIEELEDLLEQLEELREEMKSSKKSSSKKIPRKMKVKKAA